ncbi:mediator complex subunit 15-domain-containing protein [Lipomyces starkeyi]
MMFNKILSQSPQRKQTTPTIQHSQMPPHQPSQQNQWMVDAQQSQQQAAPQQLQEPLQAYIQQQNPAGQFGPEGAANVEKPSYGPEQQERDRTRIRELYEEVSRSRSKQSPVELLPEDQTKTREMILQLQEACRQMDRLIHWAHVNFHNESVTKRLIAMQFAYRDQFEVLNRGIFYFTPESIAKFRVELSKFFNYVRRHQQLKQGNGGVALPMNMGVSMQQSASGSQVLQQQSQQAVSQGTPQQQIQQAQQLQVPPRRPPQPQMMSTMPQQGGQQMSFEPNLAFATQQQRQRQGNTVSTPTTTNAVAPQQRPMQQQQPMMSQDQQQQAVSAGSFPAQQFVPQPMPGAATPVSAPIPAPNARQPARRNQKATGAAATQAHVVGAAANGNAHSTPQNQVLTSQRPNFSLPGQVPAVMPQAQLGTLEPGATAPEPSPVISSSTSPQGVPIYTPTPLLEATQLKLPQSRKRPLGGMTSGKSTGSSPVIDTEPPLKKEKTEPKAGPKGKQASAQAKAAAAAQALAVAAEDANAKQRAAAEEVARKRRELAEKDPLGYALQAVADICGVDPQTGKDIKGTESPTTGILSQMKIMYSELLRGVC